MPSRSSAAHRASFQGHRLSQAGPQARGCTSCPGTPRLWAPHDEDGGWPLQGQQDHTAAGEEALLENGGPAEEGRVELTPASARRLSWRRAEPAPPRASGEVGSRSVQVRYSGLGCPESVAPARVGRQSPGDATARPMPGCAQQPPPGAKWMDFPRRRPRSCTG